MCTCTSGISGVQCLVQWNAISLFCVTVINFLDKSGHLESTQVVKIKIKTFAVGDRWGKLAKPSRISNLARKPFQLTAYNTFTPFKAQSETTVPVNSAQDKYSVSLLLGTELHGHYVDTYYATNKRCHHTHTAIHYLELKFPYLR